MIKTDIINWLGAKHGFTSYLEICTPTTGIRFGEVNRGQFTTCNRLMYRWCPEVSDGFAIDYPMEGEAIESVAAEMHRRRIGYDLVLVDPWHSYESSLSALRLALSVLNEAGVIVVHDCSPPSMDLTNPSFMYGSWCGLTYAALIDFVAGELGLDLYAVDTDYGCGILRKRPPAAAIRAALRPDPEALKGWNAIGGNFEDRYRFFDSHRVKLLNLISTQEFLDREGLGPRNEPRRSLSRRFKEDVLDMFSPMV